MIAPEDPAGMRDPIVFALGMPAAYPQQMPIRSRICEAEASARFAQSRGVSDA
jgi:hypothetical protein